MNRLLLLGFLLATGVIHTSYGELITHRVTVQPIRIHSGSECANPAGELFDHETDKIFAQAGVDVRLLPIVTITNASFFELSSNISAPNSLHALAQMPGSGAHPDPSVLNVWFVRCIDNSPSVLGFALQTSIPFGSIRPKNGIAISDYAFSFAGGRGMRDIIAHELGHNLSLYHGADESGVVQASGELNLMSRRSTFPTTSDDIVPHGAQLGQLNAYQISRILSVSPYVISLPAYERYEYTAIETPVPPSDAAAVALSSSEINLAWNDASDDEDGFRIYRSEDGVDFHEIATVNPDVLSYIDSGLSEQSEYIYEIVAFNAAGESEPVEASAVTLAGNPVTPPICPTSFLVALTGPHSISMNWIDRAVDELGYQVERSTDGVNFKPVAVLPADSQFYTDTQLAPLTIYYYRVRAFNSAGFSLSSNPSHTKTRPPLPAVPVWVSAAPGNWSSVLSWQFSPSATWFRVLRATSLSGPFESLKVTTDLGWTDCSVAPGITYYYRLCAINISGESDPSSIVAVTPNGAPSRPGSLLVALTGPQTIDMTWVDMSGNEAGFRVERSTDAINYSPVATLPAGSQFYSDSGLQPETIYYYRVRAFNGAGASIPSNGSHTKTRPETPPHRPGSFLVALTGPQTIGMSWVDRSDNELGFLVERSTDGANFSPVAVVPAGTEFFSDSGLAPATIFYYRVRAFNYAGYSYVSNSSHTKTRP